MDVVRRVFQRVLRELADIEHRCGCSSVTSRGDDGLLAETGLSGSTHGEKPKSEPTSTNSSAGGESSIPTSGTGDRSTVSGAARHLPSVATDPEPGHARSRFDADAAVALFNDSYADYLMVKDDEAALLDYLDAVAKEYVLYNDPRATGEDLAEEMVRMLVRVRRHLPRSARPPGTAGAQLLSGCDSPRGHAPRLVVMRPRS